MAVLTLTGENFEEQVLKAEGKVLVDFWAEWCSPCKMLAPVITQIEEEIGDTVKVGKVNIDEEGALAQKYRIMSIPTLMLFEQGKAVEILVGVRSKAEILEVCKK